MTKVPEYNLPKFPPMPPTKNDKIEYSFKKRKYYKGIYRTRKEQLIRKKIKLIDKHLFGELHDQDEHVRNIGNGG